MATPIVEDILARGKTAIIAGGIQPIENSQYWISPFGEELFNELWKNKQTVAQYIKSSTYLVFSDEKATPNP